MKKKSKRFKSIENCIDETSFEDALFKIKEQTSAKFDESVDISINLNLEKKHTVRDAFSFPNSFGKLKKVLVFARDQKAEEAKEAGADYVGGNDFIEKIQGGWLEFDTVVATPDMMRDVAKVARILGSRGLMPNPKAKTVSNQIKETVREVKAGRNEFRTNPEGVLNYSVGKKSMPMDSLLQNIKAFVGVVIKKKPSDLKGEYIKSVFLTSTMGKSVAIDKKLVLK